MKPPRPTTGHLLILIAWAAVASYAAYLVRRSEALRAEAERHHAAWISHFDSNSPIPSKAHYHHAMKWKYRHAARYPWLPVEPDPPEPE
jgi:hypothetical protein